MEVVEVSVADAVVLVVAVHLEEMVEELEMQLAGYSV